MHRLSGKLRNTLSVLVSGLVLSGCAGENLFSLAASVAEAAVEVSITTPGEGATIAPGDSISIAANLIAATGLSSVTFRGNYTPGGELAYTTETGTLAGETSLNVTNFLLAVGGQTAGSVYIVVEASDLIGGMGKDSVKVTIVQN